MTNLSSRRIRVSIIDFLNAAPLSWAIEEGFFPGIFAISRDLPAVCAEKLRRGEADVGLVPSIAYQTTPGLRVLPDLCIAADGDVRSVLLLARRDLSSVRTVAVDPASRTSVVLLRILLRERYGIVPEMVAEGGEPGSLLSRFDAVLAIGDRALQAKRRGVRAHDLAGLWKRHTGLPFVFAFWAVREGVDLRGTARLFPLALAIGRGHLDAIIDRARRKVRLQRKELLAYYTRHLVYDMGPAERRSLTRFYREARRLGSIPGVEPLRFYRGQEDSA